MSDIECPYCGFEQEVCNDDGFGLEEGVEHEYQCCSCEKNFVFTTCISFDYYPSKADCLNGSDHKLKPSMTVPRRYTKMICSDCGFNRPMRDEEFVFYGIEK